MKTSISYIPKGLVSQELYPRICDIIDDVISKNETEFRDILNKYKDYDNMSGEAVQETLKEFGYESIIKILNLPDSTSARLGYFLNAISLLKGHKEGVKLVCRLLGGNAVIKEWFDDFIGYSDGDWTASTAYTNDFTVKGLCPSDGNTYLYKATITGGGISGPSIPAWPDALYSTVLDNEVTWENIGKPQVIEYWQPNKAYVANQHVIAPYYTRVDGYTTPDALINPAPLSNNPFPNPRPAGGKHYVYRCVAAGTTGATPPAFPTTIGNAYAVVDNTVTWVCLDPEAYYYFDIVWSFPPASATPYTIDYFREFIRSYVYPVLSSLLIAATPDPVTGAGGSWMFSLGCPWCPSQPVSVGTKFVESSGHFHLPYLPTPINTFYLECKLPGITDAVEPNWALYNFGDLIVDGTVTWEKMQIYDEPGKGYNVFDYLNEIQRIQFATTPLAGYWKASFIGQQTGELAYDIDAATLQTALEGLSTIGPGNVVVTGDITTSFEIEFVNVLQGTNVPMIYLDLTHLV
jgi:hypothetical protein